MGTIMSYLWVEIVEISSVVTLVFIICSFLYHNHRQNSHKIKLFIVKSCLMGTELEIDFRLENKTINNIHLKEVKLIFMDAINRMDVPAKSNRGNVLLYRNNGILFAGGSEIYSAVFTAIDAGKFNENMKEYIIYIYSMHSDKPVYKKGNINTN